MEDITTMKELLTYFLRLIYDAEMELSETLPQMKDEVTAPDLKQFFSTETEGRKRHQMRFEMILRLLKEEPSNANCDDMVKYLVSTKKGFSEKYGNGNTTDHMMVTLYYALINYMINIHEEAIKCSKSLGYDTITRMLKRFLREESELAEQLRMLEKSHPLPEQNVMLY